MIVPLTEKKDKKRKLLASYYKNGKKTYRVFTNKKYKRHNNESVSEKGILTNLNTFFHASSENTANKYSCGMVYLGTVIGEYENGGRYCWSKMYDQCTGSEYWTNCLNEKGDGENDNDCGDYPWCDDSTWDNDPDPGDDTTDDEVNDYCDGSDPDCEESGGGSSGDDDGDTLEDDQIIIDSSFENEQCLYNVYNDLGANTSFNSYVKNFEPTFNIAHLKFLTDNSFSSNYPKYINTSGITLPPLENNIIQIVFNTDEGLNSSILKQPDVVKAVALMHELIHAEMYRKMLNALKAADINHTTLNWTNWTHDEFKTYLESLKNKYFGIWDFYTRFEYNIPENEEPRDYQHQLMAEKYRMTIQEILVEFGLTEEQEEALSWLGLMDDKIIAWKNCQNKDQIENTQSLILNSFENGCE